MRLGVRIKLFLVSFALIAVCLATAAAYLTRSVEREVTDTLREDLRVRTSLIAREASSFPASLDDLAAWDAMADAEGRAAEVRVTIIRKDGMVIGDSEVGVDLLPGVENHAGRPEVMDALATGRGEGSRLSATVHERFLYVAVPFERDGQIVGVARTAQKLSAVDAATAAVRRLISIAMAVALLIAIVVSSIAAQRISGVVGHLTGVAQRMATGDLSVRARVVGGDEIAELGRALDTVAESLQGAIAELRGERDLLGRILEGMQEGVLVLDGEGRVVLLNGALRATLLLGGDTVGKHFLELVRDAGLHELLERTRRRASVEVGEIDLPGIKPCRLLVHVAPLATDAGRDTVHGLLAVLVDVTELRRLESMRRDFVANVSHELRTPVAAVRSAAETLQGGALTDPAAAARFVGIIDRNAQRLQELIEDLLELSRLESKEFRLRYEPVDVRSTVAVALGTFREKASAKGVRLTAEVASSVDGLIGDPRALEQVLANLIDNAVKYCPSGSTVAVTASQEDGRVRFRVSDTGPGIDAKHLPRIFERFYRVDKGRSRDVGGTGLGLSIVKHLTEAMGGDVSVRSEMGRGSTFTVTLPREGRLP